MIIFLEIKLHNSVAYSLQNKVTQFIDYVPINKITYPVDHHYEIKLYTVGDYFHGNKVIQ